MTTSLFLTFTIHGIRHFLKIELEKVWTRKTNTDDHLNERSVVTLPAPSPQGNQVKTSTTNKNARGLGDPSLLQSYFVCVTESESTTLMEYGKTMGTTESGDIYLNMLDITDRLNVRFYAFGNGDKDLDVIDAHIVPRDLTEAECKGDTYMDLESRLCTQNCHEDCDPLYGKETVNKYRINLSGVYKHENKLKCKTQSSMRNLLFS